MRLIGRALALLFALAVAAWLATVAWPRVALYLAGGSLLAGDNVRTSVAYVLPAGKDVEFVLARQPSRARIAIAALTAPSAALAEDAAWHIAWTALDDEGGTIDSGEFTGTCRAPATWRDPAGRLHPVRWSIDADLAPCADQYLYLRFSAAENAARVRLRLLDADRGFRGISARVAQRVARSGPDADVAWQRLSDDTRAELTRFQVMPAFLLTPGEIDAVTANQWAPVGPQGVAGSDFGVVTLAWLPADVVERNPEGSGVTRLADASHHLTLPVYEPGEVTLRLTPPGDAALPPDAQVTFHPTLPVNPETETVPVPPGGVDWTRRVDRGLLEVASPVPLAVEVVAADGATLQHQEHRQRVLRLDDGQSAEWPVSHAAGITTALRLDARGYVEAAGAHSTEDAALDWQWLDAQGRVLRSGRLAPQFVPSLYDRPEDEGVVTDPASAWFRLPDEVAMLRVTSRGALLAAAYSRPDQSTLPRRVPAEQRGWFDDARRVPEWFPLDPVDWAARVSAQRTMLLRIQHRPLPPVPLGADTLVDVLAPREAGALAARLVLPFSAVPFKLEPNTAGLYAPVGANCRVTFTGSRGEARLAPQLLFTGGAGLAPVTVVLDGLPLDIPAPAGRAGTLDLPPVAAGAHRLCIEDRSPRRWFANYAAIGAARMIEGGGYRLDPGGALSFDVRKDAAPLTLSLRWYGDARVAAPAVLQASVEGIPARGAFAGYTLPRTAWTLPASTAEAPGTVLYRADARTAAPQAMNLTLDADLPAGTWRVRVALAAGAGGYLGVSRLEYAAQGATRVLYEVP